MLAEICVRALTAYALVAIVRATPWVEGWFYRGKKPWACDVCMTLWTSGILVAVHVAWALVAWSAWPEPRTLLADVIMPALGGIGGALFLLRMRNEIPPGAV